MAVMAGWLRALACRSAASADGWEGFGALHAVLYPPRRFRLVLLQSRPSFDSMSRTYVPYPAFIFIVIVRLMLITPLPQAVDAIVIASAIANALHARHYQSAPARRVDGCWSNVTGITHSVATVHPKI
ncbi:hypothetical protein B0H14DRAFT_3469419 [Mycena olivaceomarginata]|nr:hypothetical protein B0H14DRAFT_3469419 [Mycena olivaceomarginata]